MDQNSNPHAESYGSAIELLAQARGFLGEILAGDNLSFIRTSIDADLRKIQNKLQAMGNLHSTHVAPVAGTAVIDHGPVTHILGEEIKLRKPIQTVDLQASDSEKMKFLMSRQELLEELRDDIRTDDQLLNDLKMQGRDLLYRSAARKVGMEDYREADLNINFVTRLRELTKAYFQRQSTIAEADLATERLKQSDENDLVSKDIANDRDLAPDDQLRDEQGNPAQDSLTHLKSMIAADQGPDQEGSATVNGIGPDLSLDALSKAIKPEDTPAEPVVTKTTAEETPQQPKTGKPKK